MRETLERELKLEADEGFRLPELGGEAIATRVFTSTYHDTSDLRLARRGVTLRRRLENGRSLWQLKLPRGRARLELEVPGGPGAVPEELARLLVAHVRGRPLEPVAELRTRREGVRVGANGEELAEVVIDSVAVMETHRVVGGFSEIEVELLGGGEDELRRLSKALRRAGARRTNGTPKLLRVLGVESGEQQPTGSGAKAIEQVRAALVRNVDALLMHDPGTRLGEDPEELHQQRVAVRRLRAILRAASPLVASEAVEPLREELRWLGARLGAVRDLDVMQEHLAADVALLDPPERDASARLLEALARERDGARQRLLEALAGERYSALLDRLEAVPPELAPAARQRSLAALAAREFARLSKQMKALGPDPTSEALHAARIAGKRARYAAELAAPTVGKPAEAFVAAAKRFQDVLGDHQDATVAEALVRRHLARGARAAGSFAAGRLVERQRQRRLEARAQLPGIWAALERAGAKSWS